MSRVRENRTHGSKWRREETRPVGLTQPHGPGASRRPDRAQECSNRAKAGASSGPQRTTGCRRVGIELPVEPTGEPPIALDPGSRRIPPKPSHPVPLGASLRLGPSTCFATDWALLEEELRPAALRLEASPLSGPPSSSIARVRYSSTPGQLAARSYNCFVATKDVYARSLTAVADGDIVAPSVGCARPAGAWRS